MITPLSPFEASREAATTDDYQWLIDHYLAYLDRPGRRRYGGRSGSAAGPAATPDPEPWLNPEDSNNQWINPETGLPWMNPDQ